MNLATSKQHKQIWAVISKHQSVFPHLRSDYLARMIDAKQCVWQRGVFITFQRYQREQKIGTHRAKRGDVILHQIGNTEPGNGHALNVLREFFQYCDADVVLAVRADNERACAFYRKAGMHRVGDIEWSNGELPGLVFLKRKESTNMASKRITRTNKTLALSSITPDENNPRQHSAEQIAKIASSIERFGWTVPLILNESHKIIAGHGRYEAAKLLNITKAPTVVISGLTESEEKALLLADNQLGDMSTWDETRLDAMLETLHLEEFPLEEIGFAAWTPDEKGEQEPPQEQRFLLFDEKTILDSAFGYYRATGFPYKQLELHVQMQELNKLRAMPHGDALINSTLAYDVADTWHKHRFHAHAKAKNSPVEAFNNDKKLRKALRMTLEQGAIKTGWFGMLSLVSNTQACANFRPAFAKYLYTKYCAKKAPRVLDTSTGYGGRMLGWFCSFDRGEYHGIDPSTATHAANTEMAKALGFDSRVTLINEPAEDVTLRARYFDIAFTSPPYFRKEEYCDEETQSWIRYPEADSWREGFLRPMLALQFRALRKNAYSIINIADVNIGSKTVPLADWTVEDAREVGFEFVERLQFPMTRRLGANMDEGVASEPVFVFKR